MALQESQILDGFHRTLHRRLTSELTKRIENLATGSATKTAESTTSTAERYAAAVAYIQAITDVLDACEEIEKGIHGSRGEADRD